MRRTLFPFCLAATIWLCLAAAASANTLPNGLQLERFEVNVQDPAVVGATVRVQMTLRNLDSTPICFDAPGIFVAARTGDLSDRGNRDFGHIHGQGHILSGGQTVTLEVDRLLDAAGTWHFWPGFKINGAWGPLRWMEKTLQVGKTGHQLPPEPQAASSEGAAVSVAQLLAEPERHDGRTVTLEANALAVRKKKGLLVSLSDLQEPQRVLTAFGPGTTAAANGDKVRVTGVFRHKSRRGRYTYDNEIAMGSQAITVVDKGFFSRPGSGSETIDYRSEVRAPFDPGASGAKVYTIGQTVPVRFHTRLYNNIAKARTLVGEAIGSGAYQVARWEADKKLLGKGIGSPGKDLVWLAVHLRIKGEDSNEGEPDRWSQFPMGQDPAPCFFLTGKGGEVFWPDSATRVIFNRDRAYSSLDKVKLKDCAWRPTALVFKIPAKLQNPALACIACSDGKKFDYTIVALE